MCIDTVLQTIKIQFIFFVTTASAYRVRVCLMYDDDDDEDDLGVGVNWLAYVMATIFE